MPALPPRVWDIFCRVIDNHGDLGVCLRLARHLSARDLTPRLWVDEPSALEWMALNTTERGWCHHWPDGDWHPQPPTDVAVETFGCHLPDTVQARLAAQPPRAWINLEYLSAEAWVQRAHGLPSPIMDGPARGLIKRFCYPGFVANTGGLLGPDPRPLAPSDHGLPARPSGAQRVSLFCYPHAPLGALLQRLSHQPTQLVVLGGPERQAQLDAAWRAAPARVQKQVQCLAVPWLNQAQYDALLADCDLNVVRGEDSFVRAQWAGRPFLWHIYAQDDGSHAAKLAAFLETWLSGLEPEAQTRWRASAEAWNGLRAPKVLAQAQWDGLPTLGDPLPLQHAQAWRSRLVRLPDLVQTLCDWASAGAPRLPS
ncbi:MAG: elongation factor P maturation arginine rhamnosyltransferase EarP [Inhella sp.]|uniref:elongation factor P maturation arginine rhamnosyltransferase EarP n=1 Tax=Inhella sp. TaxID=1921806 RepID=UPI0022C7D274|nr:elongation factor P maturation arginine rhamnosyltransferase EarP [Inhella sp.]MCZ8235524.1 elongation factor P maturation arginine rhamnosyltransferase EarP [Inhella sp.]